MDAAFHNCAETSNCVTQSQTGKRLWMFAPVSEALRPSLLNKNKTAVMFTLWCLYIAGLCGGGRGHSSPKANFRASKFHEVIFLAVWT